MRPWRAFTCAVVAFVLGVQAAVAQQAASPPSLPRIVTSPILVIQSEQVYAGSDFGLRVERERLEAEAKLEAENDRIAAMLEAEELALTEERKTMTREDFRAAAEAFDAKAQRTRVEQIGKQRAIVQRAQQERQRFFDLFPAVLEQIMSESNALIVLERSATFGVRDVLDVTARARFQANAIFGDGLEAAEN